MDSAKPAAPAQHLPFVPQNERFAQYLREFRAIPSLGDVRDALVEGKRD